MPTTYLESFDADWSENELFKCVSILLTGTSTTATKFGWQSERPRRVRIHN